MKGVSNKISYISAAKCLYFQTWYQISANIKQLLFKSYLR